MSEPTPVPPGFWEDSKGRYVPESSVPELAKLRDQTVRGIVQSGTQLHLMLKAWKLNAFEDIAAFIETSAEQYDHTMRGSQGKGNVTLRTFDGRYKVERKYQDNIHFDERLLVAKALIDECINTWSAGSQDEIRVLVNDAFQVDQQGKVSVTRVLGLRRHPFKHPKWLQAMQAIADAVQVVGSRSYVNIYERVGDSDHYRLIPLNLAAL